MKEDIYSVAFKLIAAAGDSKTNSMRAIKAAKDGNFNLSKELMQSAEEKMVNAHKIQFELIQKEASGLPVLINVVLVHAQDHLTSAILVKEMAEEFIELYKKVSNLENEKNN